MTEAEKQRIRYERFIEKKRQDGTLQEYWRTLNDREASKRAREKYLRENRERWNELRRKNYHSKVGDEDDRLRRMLCDAKARAKRKGLVFELTGNDVYVPKECPVLGIPLFRGKGRPGPNSPTIDRIDNAKGYTRDNIVVVSRRANRLKSDASFEELVALCEFYKQFQG